MSSFGPFQPMMEDLRNKGRTVVNTLSHPGTAIQNLLSPPAAHQQAIDQMNQQSMQHKNDAANASFVHPNGPGVLARAAKRPR